MTQTHKHILVAGSINMDIVATTAQLPLPGQTVTANDLQYYPGGKGANQAIAARRAGVPTRMLGRVGSDAFGTALQDFLAAERLDLQHVRVANSPSGVALILVQDNGENSIVVVPGANGEFNETDLPDAAFQDVGVGIAQFEIPLPGVEAFFRKCRANNIVTLLNTAPALPEVGQLFELADVLILNETELHSYVGGKLTQDSSPARVLAQASKVQSFAAQTVIVTLGSRGAVALTGDQQIVVEGIAVQAVDTTGAGDCFVGYFAAGLAQSMSTADALAMANRAAAHSVQHPGAAPSMPLATDLQLA